MGSFYTARSARLILLVCTLILFASNALAQKVYTPASTNNLTGGATYCQGVTAGILVYTYNTCFTGSGSSSGTPITIKWYQNATNATTGGTLVSTTLVNCALTTAGNTSYQPATTTPGTSYYYCVITWTGTGTCNTTGTLTSSTVAVIVNAMPDAISGSGTACVGTSVTLSDGVAGGTWTSSNVAIATVSATGQVGGGTAGSATISYSIGSCRVTKPFSVVNVPSSITGTNTVCVGSVTSLSNATPGGSWTTASAAIATVDAASPVHVAGVAAGTTTITYGITPTCYTTRAVTVNVTPGPITGPASACQGTSVTLGNSVAGGVWSSATTGVASINASLGVVNAVTAGTSAISYTIGSCKSGVSFTVSAMPAAIGGASSLCAGAQITLTNSVAGGVWSSSSTAIASANSATGVVTGISVGNTTISYVIGSCGVSKSVTVNTQPTAIAGSSSACTGTQVTLTDATAGGAWSSVSTARATITAAGVVSAVSAGTSVISYTLGSCASTLTFTVLTTPAAIAGTQTVCRGATRTYTNSVIGGTWSSSNTAIASVNAATGVITGVTAGSANITYSTGCGTVATRAITVIAMPAAITGTTALCTGITTTLSNTVSGGVWSSTSTGVASINSSTGVVNPISAGNTTISYTIGGVCGVAAVATVNTQPLPITGASLVCSPATISLGNAAAGGAWSSSNTAIATISGTGIVSGVAAGNSTITYAIANCAAVKPVTVSVAPTAYIASAVSPCANYASAVQFAGTAAAAITYNIDGGTLATQPLTGGVYAMSTGILTSAHTYRLVEVHDANCATAIDTAVTLVPVPMQWVGGAPGHAHEWNYAANWSCGFMPDSISDVTIPAGITDTPLIGAGSILAVKSLVIDNAATVAAGAGAQLKVAGMLNNKGVFTGSGLLCLNGHTRQTIAGSGEVSNLKLQNDSGAVVDSGARLSISGTLTLAKGCLATNDSLVLVSDAYGNGRIDTMTNADTLIGKVTVQQYVQGGYRRYRFWSHPFSSSLSLGQIQKYIDITGQGGAANGFTTTSSNAASAFRFDVYTSDASQSYDPGWKPYTRINGGAADTNKLRRYQGIRLFVRGSKGEGLGYAFYYTPSPVVIGMTGNVNHGSLDVPLAKGSSANQEFNMLGNPYPSPVDIGTVLYNAKQAGVITGSAFYIWNPSLSAGGQYMTIPIGTSAPVPYSIPANTAFQIKAAYDSALLHFTEGNKTSCPDNLLFKTSAQSLQLNIYDTAYHLWDMLTVAYNDKATNGNDDDYDAVKRLTGDFAFYSLADHNEKLAIDARPYVEQSAVPLGINSAYAQDFVIRAEHVPAIEGQPVYLHDKLLQQYVLLQAGTEYKFSISKDKATQGDNRFELTTGMPDVASGLAVKISPNPANEDAVISYNVQGADEVAVSVTDVAGVCVYSNKATAAKGSMKVSLAQLPAGIYMVAVVAGEQQSVTKLVKE